MTRAPIRTVSLLAIAIAAVAALFALEGRVGFELADEGFLWYGAQRVMAGEVPLRDFMAYDPARYYWSAAVMTLLRDDGILALRTSLAIFQVIGLFLALQLVSRSAGPRRPAVVVLALITLCAWMFPRHKLFDITVSITQLAALAYLIERPSSRRYLLAGLVVGIAAVFGRNHGVYGALAGLLALTCLSLPARPGAPPDPAGRVPFLQAFLWWAGGLSAGFLPVALMALFVPGFATAFWESIRALFEQGYTNIARPVPWPWRVDFATVVTAIGLRRFTIGVFFVALLAYAVLGLGFALWSRARATRVPPVVMASLFLALPYAHVAFSRPRAWHLAQGIFPMLVGSLALLAARRGGASLVAALLLCLASLLVAQGSHPGWLAARSGTWVQADVGEDRLTVRPGIAGSLRLLARLEEEFAPGGAPLLVTPFWPGAYAVLGRRSPVWEVYALLPRSESFQRAEIERIRAARPRFVLIENRPLDGRDDLRFESTHPLVVEFVRTDFRRVPYPTANPWIQLYLPD